MISQSLHSIGVWVSDSSQVGETRRIAAQLARQLEFDADTLGKIGIVATEAANNLARHAQEGQIVLRALANHNTRGIEILSLDKGPGIANIDACMRDGFSTVGTSGTGLGSISRLSTFFDIHSVPKVGTAMVSQIWAKPPAGSPGLEIGAICLPMPGEEACGDNWSFRSNRDRQVLGLVDGLGHGPLAAQAANEAMRIFDEKSEYKAIDILQAAHAALRPTRGAAMCVAEFDLLRRTIRFAGVGNLSGVIQDVNASRSMVSHNGTLGANVQKFQEFVYPWPAAGLMVLHSDGLITHWSLDQYPGLRAHHPSLIAGTLHRDFRRGRDDATVVVVKERFGR